jgi:hypothetical protein
MTGDTLMAITKLARTLAATAAILTLATVSAKANNIDFTCSLSKTAHCTGSVTKSGSNYSTTGIDVFNDSGPYKASVPFILILNTASDAISIDGTGVYAGQNLVGNITAFTALPGVLSFNADWDTIPPLVQAQLGTPTGADAGSVIYLSIGSHPAQSVDVLIAPAPAPEPDSLFLAFVGSGLVGIGGLIRRKLCARTWAGRKHS